MDDIRNAFAVLTDAVEDCTGLWDAVWELVGVPSDDAEGERLYDSKIADAQSILQKFVSYKLIELREGKSWPSGADQEVDIPPSEVNSVFTTLKYWHPPEEGGAYICFHATSAGKDVWHRGIDALSTHLTS